MNATSNAAVERDVMEYDFLIVGAGPAGLACAIRLKQLKPDLNICVLEKGAAIGAHSLSGAVMEPGPLDQLAPEWRDAKLGVCVPVVHDELRIMTRKGAHRLPVPPQQRNHGNFIISLGLLTPWLAQKAEGLGVDVFAGFAAAAPVFDAAGAVAGVQIGDMGIAKNGEPGPNYAPGPQIRAHTTILAEGCRGSLTKQLIARFALAADSDPQTFGLGFKELWQLPAGRANPGLIQHSVGWPLDNKTYGGSFIYHLDADRVYVGFVVGLDYIDPRLKPFEVFQQFKHHPSVKPLLEGGEILAAGARTIAAGGWQSMPRLDMPGAVLIGDAAGTLNFAKIKGSHTAMKSGMVAAETVFAAISAEGKTGEELSEFTEAFMASWAGSELLLQRNFGPAQHRFGNIFGSAYAFIDINVFSGKLPWTFSDDAPDHEQLKPAAQSKHIEYPKPDGVISFDRLSSVFLSNTNHEEDQPCHLTLRDPEVPIRHNLPLYDEPAQRYCPAGVYEIVDTASGGKRLQINAQNCVHCKTCDIKDPTQNIVWTTPEGGGGPNYPNM